MEHRKRKIPACVKNCVWDKYIGICAGTGTCFCCTVEPITRANFQCGHVLSEATGGTETVDNLRPICQNCNASMGIRNMEEFMEEHGMQKRNNWNGIEFDSKPINELFTLNYENIIPHSFEDGTLSQIPLRKLDILHTMFSQITSERDLRNIIFTLHKYKLLHKEDAYIFTIYRDILKRNIENKNIKTDNAPYFIIALWKGILRLRKKKDTGGTLTQRKNVKGKKEPLVIELNHVQESAVKKQKPKRKERKNLQVEETSAEITRKGKKNVETKMKYGTSDDPRKCEHITKNGSRCNGFKKGMEKYCAFHLKSMESKNVKKNSMESHKTEIRKIEDSKKKCSYIKKNGERCKKNARLDSEYCTIHMNMV